jgi:hypothetical protein
MCGDRTAMICRRQRHSSFHGRSTRSLIRRPSDPNRILSGNRRPGAFARRWHERDRLWHSVCDVLWPSCAGQNECSTGTAIGRNWIGLSFSIGASWKWNRQARLSDVSCAEGVNDSMIAHSVRTRRVALHNSWKCRQVRRKAASKEPVAVECIESAYGKTGMVLDVHACTRLASTPLSFELADGSVRTPGLGAANTKPAAAAGPPGCALPCARDRAILGKLFRSFSTSMKILRWRRPESAVQVHNR